MKTRPITSIQAEMTSCHSRCATVFLRGESNPETSNFPAQLSDVSAALREGALANAAGKRRIYVVDDERLIAETLCLILNKSGYEASMFFSAESVLEAVNRCPPDLVLSDVMMTGHLNGVELAEILAKTHPEVQVLLMSGQGRFSEPFREAGKRGFVPNLQLKPVAPKELLHKIQGILHSAMAMAPAVVEQALQPYGMHGLFSRAAEI